jgi:iron complex transport system ATP-binding protein
MSERPPPGLAIGGLTVRYGDWPALNAVSLEVAPGEVLALAGPNGSGKSTLIRAVATDLAGTAGEVRVLGQPLAGLRPIDRARRVAWMPQEEPLGDNVPLADYVEYGRYAHLARWSGSSSDDRAAVAAALEEVDLADLASRGLHELSGGERQRARLARALAQDAPVLLLDEPTAHLDVGHQLDVLDRVRTHARLHHRAILVALHDLNLAARFTDRVAVLAHGRLRAVGPPADVLSAELLAEIWGVVAEMRRDPRSGLPYLIPQLPLRSAPARPPHRGFRVHVVGGGGSGAPLLRGAIERGWDVSAGVLPLFDSDSELVREYGVPAAFELPFAPIGPEALVHLDGLLELADAIVVAPFPVGPTNLANLEHLVTWAHRRPVLLLDHAVGERWDYADGRAESVRAKLLGAGATAVSDAWAALESLSTRSTSSVSAPAATVQ